MEKVCGNCGRSFPCGGGIEPCWCDQVRLNESQLTEIGQTFRDCLCPACLEKINADQSHVSS
ncbi:MAG TPA: cysteine-rich CWC family protein [Nitrospirales bacterium]